MKNFHLKRLERLIEIVKAVPKYSFNMNFFCELPGSKYVSQSDTLAIQLKKGCGTVGCALGWAGLDPSFRKAGLKTNQEDGNVYFNRSTFYFPTSSVMLSYNAGAKFFGLEEEEAHEIFDPNYYDYDGEKPIERRTVISRIRKLINQKKGAKRPRKGKAHD